MLTTTLNTDVIHNYLNTEKVLLTNDSSELTEADRVLNTLNLTRLIFTKILAPIITGVGITANILNVVVLTRKWMLSSTNYYLRAVAICDILYLANFILLSLHLYKVMLTVNVYMYLVPIMFGLGNVCSNATAWLTCTFTIERYIAVCHPMLGRKVCTRERAFWIIIAVTTISTLLTVPDFLQRQTHLIANTTNKYEIKKTIHFTRLSKAGWPHIQNTLFVYIPIVLLCFFNYQLIRSVILATHARHKMAMNSAQLSSSPNRHTKALLIAGAGSGGIIDDRRTRQASEQQKITIMLIAVVVVFVLCQMPSVVSNTIASLYRKPCQANLYRMKILGNISNILLVMSAALNFFLYSCFSTKFRRTFQRVFCRCWLSADSAGLQMMDYTNNGNNSRSALAGQSNANLLPTQTGTMGVERRNNKDSR